MNIRKSKSQAIKAMEMVKGFAGVASTVDDDIEWLKKRPCRYADVDDMVSGLQLWMEELKIKNIDFSDRVETIDKAKSLLQFPSQLS